MSWQWWSVLPVWVIALSAAIGIGLAAPASKEGSWIPIAFAGTVTLTFFIQLAIQRKEGLVLRAMASIGGSVLILAAATGILALVH
ncbi:MAG: hypothetical protein EPN91_00700 [Salinibacterium sp.]|nr:MAG: hypothetical protein EPN91_00700 [Salinibacterium sp.]